jgi:hypothetical protein
MPSTFPAQMLLLLLFCLLQRPGAGLLLRASRLLPASHQGSLCCFQQQVMSAANLPLATCLICFTSSFTQGAHISSNPRFFSVQVASSCNTAAIWAGCTPACRFPTAIRRRLPSIILTCRLLWIG